MKLSGTRDLVALLYRIVASPTCKSFEAVTLMAEHAELVKAIVSKAPQARVSHVHMVAALKQMHARKPCIFANKFFDTLDDISIGIRALLNKYWEVKTCDEKRRRCHARASDEQWQKISLVLEKLTITPDIPDTLVAVTSAPTRELAMPIADTPKALTGQWAEVPDYSELWLEEDDAQDESDLDLDEILSAKPLPSGHQAISKSVTPKKKGKQHGKKGVSSTKTLSMNSKCVHSRAYHRERKQQLANGRSPEEAKKLATIAAKKAVQELKL